MEDLFAILRWIFEHNYSHPSFFIFLVSATGLTILFIEFLKKRKRWYITCLIIIIFIFGILYSNQDVKRIINDKPEDINTASTQSDSVQEELPNLSEDSTLVEIIAPSTFQKRTESPISVVAIEKLALRTGPSIDYVELYTLPTTTNIVAYEQEEGNGVMWVLLEYSYGGQVWRGYTSVRRVSLRVEDDVIPLANHYNRTAYCIENAAIYAAPAFNAANRATILKGEKVTILNFDGIYAYIEFYDNTNHALSRGYIEYTALSI